MAKHDEYNFEDEFEFDENFDLDGDGGFEGPPITKGRKVVNALTGSFVDGVKSTIYSEQFQEDAIGKLLPPGYVGAFGDVNKAKDELQNVHRTLSDGLGKEINKFKKTNQEAIKRAASNLPGKMGTKVSQWADNVNSGEFPKFDQEKMQTETMLGDVFGAAGKIADEYQTKAALENVVETKKQTDLSVSTNDLLFGIGNSVGKLVGYQDNVSIKYQRKMLELTFKQLTVQRKNLDVSEKLLDLQTSSNKTLVHNTALPDMLKVHNSELLGRNLKEQFIGSVTAPMFNDTRDFMGRVGEKVTGKLKNTFENSGMVTDLLGQVLGHFSEEEDELFGTESNSVKLARMLGGQVGNTALPKLLDKFAPGLSENLAKNGNVSHGGKVLENLRLRGGQLAQKSLVTGQTGNKYIDGFSKFFDLADLQNEKNEKIQGSVENNLTDITGFDVQAKRTLTDVIPGLLGRIHTEMRRFNGDATEGHLKYDWKMGGFAQDHEQDTRLVNNLIKNTNIEMFSEAEAAFLRSIDPSGKKLSETTKGILARQMSIAGLTGQPLSLQHFIEPNSDKYIPEFAEFMLDEYQTESIGSFNNTVKDDINFITKGASESFLDKDNELQKELLRLKSGTQDPLKELIERAKQGDISTLKKYPFIKQSEAGTFTVDYEAYYDYAHTRAKENKPLLEEDSTTRIPEEDWSVRNSTTRDRLNELRLNLKNSTPSTDDVKRLATGAFADGKVSIRDTASNAQDLYRDKVNGQLVPTTKNKMNAVLLLLANGSSPVTDDQLEGIVDQFEDGSTRSTVSSVTNTARTRTEAASVWVKGEVSPRLDALSMRMGKYLSLDTGKTIRSLDDITGDIISNTGDVLLTTQHLDEGLVDKQGKELKGGWTAMAGGVFAQAGNLKGLLTTGITPRSVTDLIKGTGISAQGIKSKLTGWKGEKEQQVLLEVNNLKQNTKQSELLETVSGTLKQIATQGTKSRKFNDRDGDGDRDGSWLDILQRRREGKKKDVGDVKIVEKDKKEKKEGLLSKLIGFIPSLIPMVGGLFSKAFGFAMPALTGLLGSAIKLAIPAALGALGLKWLANKWLNREGAPEMIAPDDPRLDPESPMYDPELEVTEAGFGDKIANKVKNMGLVPSIVAGYAAWKGGKYLLGKGAMALGRGALGAGRWGVNRLMGRGTAAAAGAGARGGAASAVATARLNAALIARGAARGGVAGGARTAARIGAAATGAAASSAAARVGAGAAGRAASSVGLGFAAKLAGKTLLRGFMGPVGWAWLAYDVISFGVSMYKKHVDDGKKLNRLRIAQYGYHHTDKEHVQKILALEGELVKHVTMKGKSAVLKDTITVDQVMQYFNVTQADAESTEIWNSYFFGRFLPVFLSYVTAMQAMAQRYDIFEMDIVLDPSQQLKVCDETLFTREQDCPYDILESGFAGEDNLDMTREKVMDTFKLIRGTLETKAIKTEGTYTKASDVKDEKTRAARADELAVINAEAIEGRKPWNPKQALDNAIDRGTQNIFGTGMMGNVMATVAKTALLPQRLALGAGNWLWDKMTGGGSGEVSGTPPNFTGSPAKGWTPEVAAAVKWGAEQLGINPNYLASVISFETGGTFSPNARNPGSSGTGLIQFMNYADGKKDGKYYGMTRDQFGALSVADQMVYVVKYFKGKGLKAGASLGAVYDAVTGTGYKSGSAAYESNKVWDANKDGVISPGESVTSGAFKAHMKDFFGSSNAAGEAASGNAGAAPQQQATQGAAPQQQAAQGVVPQGAQGVAAQPRAASGWNMNNSLGQPRTASSPTANNQRISPGTGPMQPNPTGTSVQNGTVAGMIISFPGTSTGGTPSLISVPHDHPAYKMAIYAKNRALASSSGYCAKYVREALQNAGGYTITPQNSAYMYHTNGVLAKAGFVQIQPGTKWQVGDVMVFQNNSAHVHGHIQIFHGTGWVSDFIQQNWKPYRNQCPQFSLWRDSTILNGATAASGWTPPDSANVGGADGTSIAGGTATFGDNTGGSTGRKWSQKRAIRGGDALWGTGKVSTSAESKDAKVDKEVKGLNAESKDAKADTTAVKSQASESEKTAAAAAKAVDAETKSEEAKAKAAVKATTTSVKSAEARQNAQPAAKQTQEAVKAQEEIKRKEKDQKVKQQTALAARESEASIWKQQLQVQSDTLNEIRGLRSDIQTYAKGSIIETRALKDVIKTAQPVANATPEQPVKPGLSPVQAPDNILEPISLLKS